MEMGAVGEQSVSRLVGETEAPKRLRRQFDSSHFGRADICSVEGAAQGAADGGLR